MERGTEGERGGIDHIKYSVRVRGGGGGRRDRGSEEG